jgi:hypothetical protein
MPAHVRMTDLSPQHCNALRSGGGKIVVSVDNATKTAVLKGTISQVLTALQTTCDEIRERDGAKAQNYRMLVGVRNRLEGEKDLATKGTSKTVEILPNGASVEREVPSVLDGLPVVTDAAAPVDDAPAVTESPVVDDAPPAEPAEQPAPSKPAEQRVSRRAKDKSGGVNPALTPSMRDNFEHLAKNANTPAAREHWQNALDSLPADEPSELFV